MSQIDQIERLQNMNSLMHKVINTEPVIAEEINRQLQVFREKHNNQPINRKHIHHWAHSIFSLYRNHAKNWAFKFSITDQSTGYSPLWMQEELNTWIQKNESADSLLIVLFGMKDLSHLKRPDNDPSFETDRAYLESFLARQAKPNTQILLLIV